MINPVASDVMLVGETDYRMIEFSGQDVAKGVTITGAAVAVSPASGLTLVYGSTGLITTDGTTCYAWLTAGTPGTYEVTFTVTFSDSKRLVRVYEIKVF